MRAIFAYLMGLLFGVGLMVAGMTNPAKVLGFLDLAGAWDPSLMGVMVGAIIVTLGVFTLTRQRGVSCLGAPLQWPSATNIDRPLIFGNVLFGVGWGLAGICPGPAIVGVGAGVPQAVIFAAAMLLGMAVHGVLTRKRH